MPTANCTKCKKENIKNGSKNKNTNPSRHKKKARKRKSFQAFLKFALYEHKKMEYYIIRKKKL